ncbi:hypothetical protein [Plasmodium yoelii yoelii]|uniref:Phenylalanyl tRNA synthetase beta chain core domain-containing protein n=1 Tax=Plasmodium yoelii yoelii TaxID=73239 RepID=Q7RM06_PLAYO|nr:hypothetical protein [Plasmodium yoelii yoelii]
MNDCIILNLFLELFCLFCNVASYDELASYPSFLDERVVNIVLRPQNLIFGIMGVIHPNVLENFSINIPVSAIEINLDALLNVLFI